MDSRAGVAFTVLTLSASTHTATVDVLGDTAECVKVAPRLVFQGGAVQVRG